MSDWPGDDGLRAVITEVAREVSARRRLYPRWVAEGRLPEKLAAERLELMEAALAALRALDQPELAL